MIYTKNEGELKLALAIILKNMNYPVTFDLNQTLELYRIAKKSNYTIGRLFLAGAYICDTLEPPVRLNYILGSSALPPGDYVLQTDIVSKKFKGYRPRIINFSKSPNILIHEGNNVSNTEGCILVGFNDIVGSLVSSKVTFVYLYARIKKFKYLKLSIS